MTSSVTIKKFGDFGRSYVNDYVVMDAVIEALPNTLYLVKLVSYDTGNTQGLL